MASAFSELEDGARLITHAPHNQFDADIWPLLSENKSGSDLAEWLTARIIEIEKDVTCLPSISIFVDGDDKIAPLVKVLEPLLSEHNIGVVGCEEGRAVGDNQEVRVFDIRYIKGLEFEAAFFVGIDKMQQRIPDLFQRFLYVGMTRPATYLGLTCEASLPKILSPIKSHLSDKDWAKSTV